MLPKVVKHTEFINYSGMSASLTVSERVLVL